MTLLTPAQEPIVFVVDDDFAIRDALSLILEQEGLAVKAFASAKEFLEFCRPEHRGCVIIDLRMPGMNGLELMKILSRRGLLLPVVFLTGYGDIATSVKAIKEGAEDFLTKPVSREKLLASVRSALQQHELRHESHEKCRQAKLRLKLLTEREREITSLALRGHSNKEIARILGISYRTVEIHRSNILHKTETHSLLDLEHLVQQSGLLLSLEDSDSLSGG